MYAFFGIFRDFFSLMALMHVIFKIDALMKNSKKIEQKMRTLMFLNAIQNVFPLLYLRSFLKE